MLRKLSCWNDDLSGGNIIIRQEHNLKKIADIRIAVDNSADSIDKLNDNLGCIVSRGSLSSNHNDARNELVGSLLLYGLLDLHVAMNGEQDVQELSLVLMYTLNLNIKERIYWNIDASGFLNKSL